MNGVSTRFFCKTLLTAFFCVSALSAVAAQAGNAASYTSNQNPQLGQPRPSPRPSPSPANNVSDKDAFLASLQGKPAWLLLSYAAQTKEAGHFDEAILYLRGALQSTYGVKEFDDALKQAVQVANDALQSDAQRYLTPYLKKDPQVSVPEKLVNFYLKDKNVDNATGLTRASFEMRTYTDVIPPEKLWKYFLGKASDTVKQELAKRFPKNPLRFFDIGGKRFAEGYFNSEYPEVIPEVNYELGLLYKDTQDYILADRYLKVAIDQEQYFSVPEKAYAAKYALTDMYAVRGQTFAYQYETTLKSVVADDIAWSSQESSAQKQRDQIRKLFMEDPQSLDRVVKLFRLTDGFSRDAHRLLGIYYLERRNYEEALPHLLFAAVQVLSKTIDEVRARNYGYNFSTMNELFDEVKNYPELEDYLQSSHIYETLFALSEAALGYRPNFTRPSRLIWSVLSQNDHAGEFMERSRTLLRLR